MQQLRMFYLILVWLVAASLALPVLAGEAFVPLGTAVDRIDLTPSTYLLEDKQGTLTMDDVRQPAHSARFVPGSPKVGLSTSVYWMRFELRNPEPTAKRWWFDTGNRRLFAIDLYAPDADGKYVRQSASAVLPFSARPLPTHDIVFPVALAAKTDSTLYLRVLSDDSVGIQVTPALWAPDAFRKHQTDETAQWFLYCGVALALVIINFSIYLLVRDLKYLLYTLSVVSTVLLVSTARGGYGAAIEYFWPNAPNLQIVLGSLTAFATYVLILGFSALFTGLPQQLPRLWRGIVWWLVPTALCSLAYSWMTVLHQPEFVPWIHLLVRLWGVLNGLLMLAGLVAWTYQALRGNRSAMVVVGAFTPLLACGVWVSAMAARGGSSNAEIFLWASMFEMLVMSLALAYRFHDEVKAKVAAKQSLVDTLKRSESELESKVTLRTAELQGEQARTRDLLANILPNHVIDELTATGKVRPAEHKLATILFTDLAGFTQATASMPAERMVAELNDIFAAFDDITRQEGVEKIKTIGDAYMAVAGLSSNQSDHAQRCTRVALRMQAFMAQRNQKSAFKWSLRVGLHSGPVISGVVGKHKYAFDVWGDSVNLAARMESSGEAGKVNISAFTYDLLDGAFECEYRGKISAKGKGEVDMYFVNAPVP
jgi:class 3 adenylate cyclase